MSVGLATKAVAVRKAITPEEILDELNMTELLISALRQVQLNLSDELCDPKAKRSVTFKISLGLMKGETRLVEVVGDCQLKLAPHKTDPLTLSYEQGDLFTIDIESGEIDIESGERESVFRE